MEAYSLIYYTLNFLVTNIIIEQDHYKKELNDLEIISINQYVN